MWLIWRGLHLKISIERSKHRRKKCCVRIVVVVTLESIILYFFCDLNSFSFGYNLFEGYFVRQVIGGA